MRKPGEPIYLRVHLIALALVLLATVALPRAAEFFLGPLSFGTRALAGIAIAVAGGIALYVLYNSSASISRMPAIRPQWAQAGRRSCLI